MKCGPFLDTMNRFTGDNPSVQPRIVLQSGINIHAIKSEPKSQQMKITKNVIMMTLLFPPIRMMVIFCSQTAANLDRLLRLACHPRHPLPLL